MAIIALIPARGGSRRIPNKNIADCFGKPLLQWTIEAAKDSNLIDRIILSTDSPTIAEIGKQLGAEVPFIRPSSLAQTNTLMVPVMQHALRSLQQNGCVVDTLVLLQPTQPLRQGHHIDEALSIFSSTNSTTVVSVVETPHIYNPDILHRIRNNRLVPYLGTEQNNRQESSHEKIFARNGPAILINKPIVIELGKKFGDPLTPYIMSRDCSIDIDEPLDLFLAECMLRRRFGPL